MNLPAKIYTHDDVQRAKKSGKLIGWIQGAGIVIGAAFLWNLLGWIPSVIVLGAVVYVLYKVLTKPSKPTTVDVDELNIDDLEV